MERKSIIKSEVKPIITENNAGIAIVNAINIPADTHAEVTVTRALGNKSPKITSATSIISEIAPRPLRPDTISERLTSIWIATEKDSKMQIHHCQRKKLSKEKTDPSIETRLSSIAIPVRSSPEKNNSPK